MRQVEFIYKYLIILCSLNRFKGKFKKRQFVYYFFNVRKRKYFRTIFIYVSNIKNLVFRI